MCSAKRTAIEYLDKSVIKKLNAAGELRFCLHRKLRKYDPILMKFDF